jgi:hypothetical protein
MDLKRASLGFWRGSDKVGKRFIDESIKRRGEIDLDKIPIYLQLILKDLKNNDPEKLLMYSTLIQNYLIKSSQ